MTADRVDRLAEAAEKATPGGVVRRDNESNIRPDGSYCVHMHGKKEDADLVALAKE